MGNLEGHATFWDGVVAAAGALGGFLVKAAHGRATATGDEYAKKEDLVQLKKDLKEHEDREAGHHEAVMGAIADLRTHIDNRVDAGDRAANIRIDSLMMRDPGK